MKLLTILLIVSLVGVFTLMMLDLSFWDGVSAQKMPVAQGRTVYVNCGLKINDRIPDLTADAYYNNTTVKVNLSDYRGKWMVLIFYPADFTFVCPTELEEMASLYNNFTQDGAVVFSVSRDTVYDHKAWHESDPRISKVEFPMLSDTTGDICRAFGTYNQSTGLSQRASFIFDPDGRLKAMEIHDDGFGRNTNELLRQLEALEFVREHPGNVCPAGWRPGEKPIQI